MVVAVALDQAADDVVAFTNGIDYPVLVDRDHELTQTYGITNVPTVVWIDEHDRIVRPNSAQPGTDTFVDFTGVESEPGKEAVRRWVRDGVVDVDADEAGAATTALSDAEIEARLRFRIATHLGRAGDEAGARAQLEAAIELAPLDFTIRRAALPLLGEDPFGEQFFALWEDWKAADQPYNGLSVPLDG